MPRSKSTPSSPKDGEKRSYYTVTIKGTDIDVYDILTAYHVTCPAVAHAIKKLLRLGKGHKSPAQDISEAKWSLQRAESLRFDIPTP